VKRDLRIAIAGAGIGGLAAALALQRAGFRPRVYEQSATLGDVGAGISISPNAAKALGFLGLGEALVASACVPPIQVTRHFRTGKPLLTIDRSDTVERYGERYYQMHRGDLHAMLLAAVRAHDAGAVQVASGLRTAALPGGEDAGGGVDVELAEGIPQHVDLLVGADGLRSSVRAALFDDGPPEFSGYVAWRGLIPAAGVAHLALGQGSSVSAGPGRLFVRYPVRGGEWLNYVAFARTGRWEAESWSQPGSVDEVCEALHDFHPEVHEILRATPGGRCHKWGLFAREPMARWSRGAVVLLGDAAHPMMPWFGQGAATALEDAVVFGRCFAAAGDIGAALRRYEAARVPRVTMVHRESLLGGERLAGTDPDSIAPGKVRNEDTLGLFSYDPATVAV
jgi:salicylate hydroxylase